MLQVQLNPGLRGGKWAYLRPLCGHDEASVNGTSAVEATALLDQLLVEAPGTTVEPGHASELAVCDCDRLFAALYKKYFGERIESSATCRDCNEPFELSLSLQEFTAKTETGTAVKAEGPDNGGIYRLPDGRRFRLPTAADLHSINGLEAAHAETRLLELCVVEGDLANDSQLLQAAMMEVGVTVDFDLDVICPECGSSQTVQFNIQDYLLRVLGYEKRFLHREIHHIALAYGWGYEEILNLTRDDRRTFTRLIGMQFTARQRPPS